MLSPQRCRASGQAFRWSNQKMCAGIFENYGATRFATGRVSRCALFISALSENTQTPPTLHASASRMRLQLLFINVRPCEGFSAVAKIAEPHLGEHLAVPRSEVIYLIRRTSVDRPHDDGGRDIRGTIWSGDVTLRGSHLTRHQDMALPMDVGWPDWNTGHPAANQHPRFAFEMSAPNVSLEHFGPRRAVSFGNRDR